MNVTNLQIAIVAHLQWKAKLSDFFYGVEELRLADVPDHIDCEFGQLFYNSIMQEFSDFKEISELEQLHKEVHSDIKHLLHMPAQARKGTRGRQALNAFKRKCDRLVQIMERLKKKVTESTESTSI